jgi:DNA-binding beta-propeller fold protein YncE
MKFCAFLKRLAPVGLLVIVSVLRAGDVALSDGQNADNVVGQTDGGGAGVYTQGGPFNSNPLDGLNYPYDVAIDTTNHRLFVADTSSHRILEYDLNSSNVLVDLSADRVLGQADFSSNLSGTSANQLKSPIGLCYWPSTNQLFVVEFENNRVMVFDVGVITNGENAVKVLGQANFTAAASATTQSGLAAPYGVTLESSASLLYVADGYNNRVMVFNVAAITNGENAVKVLGQSNFTSNSANVTQNTMAIPRGVVHTQSGKLFVSDNFSNRVLVFDTAVITDGENAVNVLGQSNFTSGGSAVTQSGMNGPFGLGYDGTTNRLFVADSAAARVLVFDVGGRHKR